MSKRFVLSLYFIPCILFLTSCERKKDIGRVSSATDMVIGSESPADTTDDEISAMTEIVQSGLTYSEMSGGGVEIPDSTAESESSAKKCLDLQTIAKIIDKLAGKKFTKIILKPLTGEVACGFLGFALLFGELTADTQQESMFDYIKRNLTNQELQELRNIKAGVDGWFLESRNGDACIFSRVTRIDGAYAKSFDDLVKVRQNTTSAQKVIKRIEIKVIVNSAEQYTGITDPASKTPTVLHTISYFGQEVLSAGFTYNVDMKYWEGATITKKTSVGVTATCTPTSNGVDWKLEGPYWQQQWQFSYDPASQGWNGFFAVKIWDYTQESRPLILDMKNEQSGKGLLSVLNLFTRGGVDNGEGALIF